MEVGLAILLFICMTALLYVLLSLKITRQVDLQMKEFYKTRIHADIQEFYREMEGYAALMENRIQRFKSLIERSEALPDRALHVQAAEQPELPQVQPSPMPQRAPNKKAAPQKPAAPETKKHSERVAKQAAKSEPVKPAKAKTAKRPVAAAAAPAVAETPRVLPVKQVEPSALSGYSEPVSPAAPDTEIDADTTIAEELMKDLFAHDEIELTRRVKVTAKDEAPKASTPQAAQPTGQTLDETSSVTDLLARIGKAVGPAFFGKAPESHRGAAMPTAQAVDAQRTSRGGELESRPTDFAEILRRAEQIKAEKKAERERRELEARAEFYATGDEFVSTTRTQVVESEQQIARAAQPAQRNRLAVKSLDEHTISFLIDSLKHDAPYRKQALRALTENNIPLEEIARRSRIDIGELQLMSQLGKF
jgi:hypothetical protein